MSKNRFLNFTVALVATIFGQHVHAQISQGGLPTSMQQKMELPKVPVNVYANPDWNEYLNEEKKMTPNEVFTKAQKFGLHVATDVSFPNSGQLTVMPNSTKVWQSEIQVQGAPALGLLFDQFKLPKGVKLFVTNANKKQVAGAYDMSNNQKSGKFAIDAVQGDRLFLELNIEPSVDINSIELHVNYVLAFHRAIEHLIQYTSTIDVWDEDLNGLSSVCNINAICPQGANYSNNRRATVQTLDLAPGGGGCSGTLINNTGNTSSDCKTYIITASHCEGTGSLANTSFDQMIIRFNFERPDCAGNLATNGQSITGVNILARADYHDTVETDDINGDFMIYQLREAIPASYGAVLAGWNRSNTIPVTNALPKKFIGFHHPYFDNKKLSTSQSIESQDWPSEAPIANGNRWFQMTEEGYVAPGSSGSGLFDGDGRLIGMASTASITEEVDLSCFVNKDNDEVYAMDLVWYDKLWHGWEYNVDGTTDNRRIKPWLDPANTGAITLDAVSSACGPISTVSINDANKELDANVSVFPNPSIDGKVNLQFNMKYAADLQVEIVDVTGRIVFSQHLKNISNGRRTVDLSNVSNGIYVVKIDAGTAYTSKKIVLEK